MSNVIFHLGAHKTATTYLQKRLKNSIALLDSHNVCYPPLGEMRKHFTNAIYKSERNDFVKKLLSLKATHRLLLSDENMAGGVDDFLRLGRQYREVGPKLAQYCALVETDQPTIFIALREYTSFIISVYCEFLRHNPFIEFATFSRQYEASRFSWVSIIEEIVAAVPKAEIRFWDFGDFGKLEEQILSAMTGLDEGVIPPLEGLHRESFSELTLQCIRALSDVVDMGNMKKLLPSLTEAFPRGAEYRAYNPYPAEHVAESKARYKSDLDMIIERFPNAKMLRPIAAENVAAVS